jgi:NDP-mannose synthase
MPATAPEHAIVLAGGRGSRLNPHTVASPKPLISLGGLTILEVIIRQLRSFGVSRVTLCVSFLADMIINECGDGRRFGVEMDYCVDAEPRGTAGPLASVPAWTGPAVVMNADILTRLNFADLFASHVRTSALLTVAAHVQELPVDYGVLHVASGEVIALVEKPKLELSVSAGIYVASPQVKQYLPAGRQFGMNDLVQELLRHGMAVRAYGFSEEWYDIGTPERLADARQSFAAEPAAYLPEISLQDRFTAT